MRVLALTRPPRVDASSRHRMYSYVKALSDLYDIEVDVQPFYTDSEFAEYKRGNLSLTSLVALMIRRLRLLLDLDSYDVLWILRGVAPLELVPLIGMAKRRGMAVLYEFDDAIYLNEGTARLRRILARGWRAVPLYTHIADVVVVGNEVLASWARKINPTVKVIPTGVNVAEYQLRQHSSHSPLVIGWIGSASTSPHLQLMLPALRVLSHEIEFEFVVMGAGHIQAEDVRIRSVPWSEEGQFGTLSTFDIGVAPLFETPFSRGKCGFKIIQYMASGIPTVASPVGIQSSIIRDGFDGFLAASVDDWVMHLIRLARDTNLRISMGHEGRKKAEDKYDLRHLVSQVADALMVAYCSRDDHHTGRRASRDIS